MTLNSNALNSTVSSQLLANLSSTSLANTKRRKDKYRTITRLKNLIQGGKSENDMHSLPPQQLKKELSKRIENLKADINKEQREREGIIKLRDIYTKNQNLGDVQATANALNSNEEKLNNLTNQLKNYQDMYAEVEKNGFCNFAGKKSSSNNFNTLTNGNGTLPRQQHNTSNNNHIYQSPSQHSVNSGNNSSVPGTPISHHR